LQRLPKISDRGGADSTWGPNGFNPGKVVEELNYRTEVPDQVAADTSKPDLKALLTKYCQLPGGSGAGHFVFEMPVVLQQAHDEVARIGSLKVPELKEAASQLFGSAQSGAKAVVQAAVVTKLLGDARAAVATAATAAAAAAAAAAANAGS
jgi:hypothetical protein